MSRHVTRRKGPSRNILLIDDNPLEYVILRKYFKKGPNDGDQFIYVSNVEHAIQCLRRQPINLVLLDDRLSPFPSAHSPLRHLRPFLKSSHTVIISSALDAGHLQNPNKLGVSDIKHKSDIRHIFESGLEAYYARLRHAQNPTGLQRSARA